MQREIRNSAKALIIKDGKMAAVKIRDGDEEWYILPGGGQEPEETMPQAVQREVLEELGIAVACQDLLFVIEGVHGERFHRVDYVFSCEFLSDVPGAVLHEDTNQAGIAWLDISGLDQAPLYPSKLRRQIMNFFEGRPHPIYLGNEEIGDPECTDSCPHRKQACIKPDLLDSNEKERGSHEAARMASAHDSMAPKAIPEIISGIQTGTSISPLP